MAWFRTKSKEGVGAVLQPAQSPSGGQASTATIWVAMIGAASAVTVAYIQHRTQVAPLELEVKNLREAQAAKPNVESDRLRALSDENAGLKKRVAELERQPPSTSKPAEDPRYPASFGPGGAQVSVLLRVKYDTVSRPYCMSALRKGFNQLKGTELGTDSDASGIFSFAYGRSTYTVFCAKTDSPTAFIFVISPEKNSDERERASSMVEWISKLL